MPAIQENSASGEPTFVIRAQDVNAVRTVDYWIKQAELEGAPVSKIKSAQVVLDRMVAWRRSNPMKVPD